MILGWRWGSRSRILQSNYSAYISSYRAEITINCFNKYFKIYNRLDILGPGIEAVQ